MAVQRSAMSHPPLVLLAMDPARTRHVLDDDLLDRLAEVCQLPDRVPVTDFADPRAAALLPELEILLTGWGAPRIDEAALQATPRLRLVAHAGGSVRFFVGADLFGAGVALTHAADANARPVAEFTLAAILFANKRVLQFRRLYREERKVGPVARLASEPIGNVRKRVGIVGASRIGRRVIELLQPFDLEILLHDPYLGAQEAHALGTRAMALDELLAAADIVSLHAPALPTTRHMLDGRRLALLRDGATLINTARGALVEQAALEAELLSGRIDAVLDVTEPEVLPAASPLYELPNVFLTPHVAGAMGLERRRLGELAIAEIERFVAGLPLRHAIDRTTFDRIA